MQNKKVVIPLIAGSCALVTIGAGTLIAYELIDKDKKSSTSKSSSSEEKPLNRGKNYEHYQLTHLFLADNAITQIVDKKLVNGKWVKSVDETKFRNYITNNIRNILKQTKEFKDDYNEYDIELNYAIQDDCRIAFDVVWSLPNSKYHYYDQLQISF